MKGEHWTRDDVRAYLGDIRFFCDGRDVTNDSHWCSSCVSLSGWDLIEAGIWPEPREFVRARDRLTLVVQEMMEE